MIFESNSEFDDCPGWYFSPDFSGCAVSASVVVFFNFCLILK